MYFFPPQLMAEASKPQTLTFSGERMSWVSLASLDELVQLKTRNPKAPLVMGNTNIGKTDSRDAHFHLQPQTLTANISEI